MPENEADETPLMERGRDAVCGWAVQTLGVLTAHFAEYAREFFGDADRWPLGPGYLPLACREKIKSRLDADRYLGERLDLIERILRGHPTSPPTTRSASGLGATPIGRIDFLLWLDAKNQLAKVDGWVLNPLDPDAAVEFMLALDGEKLVTERAGRPRPDVARRFGLDTNHGFSVRTRIPHSGSLDLEVKTAHGQVITVDSRDVDPPE